MKTFLTWLCCCFLFLPASAQIINGDFESWIPNGTQPYPTAWPSLQSYGDLQATPALSGDFSLHVNAWYYYTKTVASQNGPVSGTPQIFTGTLKYTRFKEAIFNTANNTQLLNDTAWVEAYLTLWNNNTGQRDTVGSAIKYFTSSTEDSIQVSFQIPFIYTVSVLPDSFRVSIDPSMIKRRLDVNYMVADSSGYSSDLTVDDLAFASPVSNEPALDDFRFTAFPNPGHDYLSVTAPEKGEMQLISLLGETCMTISLDENVPVKCDVSHLPKGFYTLKWHPFGKDVHMAKSWVKF